LVEYLFNVYKRGGPLKDCKYRRGIEWGVKVEIRLKVKGCEKFTPAELWGRSLEKFFKKMKLFGD
jgi:hypothetical protein